MYQDSSALVSVIVPIYNSQKYLDQCLLSIRKQTYENLEIICINDGCTDSSPEIMRGHAEEDPRVRVIDKENGGYGAGCNRGIEEAHGAWVSIVEPDDWIEPDMYRDMLDFASKFDSGPDIVKTPWWQIADWDKGEEAETRYPCPIAKRVKRSRAPFTIEENPQLLEYHPGIWSAIYRKEFLDRFSIRFPEYPGAGWADNPFLIETMCQAKGIVYLDRAYYCYRADIPGSTRNHATDEAVVRPFERWLDMLAIMKRIGVDDPRVLESHYMRGFMYVEGAIYDDGGDNPLVQRGMREVFGAMDPQIVLGSAKLSARRKREFCEVRGIAYPGGISLSRAVYSLRDMATTFRTLGPKGVWPRVRFRLTGRR